MPPKNNMSQETAPAVQPQPEPVIEKSIMFKKLSTKLFIISMSLIFLTALVYIGGLNFLLNPKTPTSQATIFYPVTSKPVSLTLNVASPEDNLLVFEPDLLIQGTTLPGATVILSSDNSNQVLTPSNNGNFTATFKLTKGVNQLVVTAFDSEGSSKSESKTVYYSPDKI